MGDFQEIFADMERSSEGVVVGQGQHPGALLDERPRSAQHIEKNAVGRMM
jgi:hypothetical protein